MLRSLKSLRGNAVLARDGEIGKVYDFYFDDHAWAVRYLIADIGQWLSGRKVVITEEALGKPSRDRNWVRPNVRVLLTREQVRSSPDVDTTKPVSRQQQETFHKHLGWAFHWLEPRSSKSRTSVNPGSDFRDTKSLPSRRHFDPHLRSAREVEGYCVHAMDGGLGHIADFIEDDDAGWEIRYLVVDTSNWLPAKRVLLAPRWLTKITPVKRTVSVDLRQEDVLNCPEFHPAAGVNRRYEEVLYDYYGRPTCWDDELFADVLKRRGRMQTSEKRPQRLANVPSVGVIAPIPRLQEMGKMNLLLGILRPTRTNLVVVRPIILLKLCGANWPFWDAHIAHDARQHTFFRGAWLSPAGFPT